MKFQIERNWIDVLGEIWMPYGAKCGTKIQLSSHDLNNIQQPYTREHVEQWLMLHSGDFSRVLDFHAVAGEVEIPWQSEENEMTWNDCMFPAED